MKKLEILPLDEPLERIQWDSLEHNFDLDHLHNKFFSGSQNDLQTD